MHAQMFKEAKNIGRIPKKRPLCIYQTYNGWILKIEVTFVHGLSPYFSVILIENENRKHDSPLTQTGINCIFAECRRPKRRILIATGQLVSIFKINLKVITYDVSVHESSGKSNKINEIRAMRFIAHWGVIIANRIEPNPIESNRLVPSVFNQKFT